MVLNNNLQILLKQRCLFASHQTYPEGIRLTKEEINDSVHLMHFKRFNGTEFLTRQLTERGNKCFC